MSEITNKNTTNMRMAKPTLRERGFLRPSVVTGAIILLVIVFMALLAPVLTPYLPDEQDVLNRRIPPIWYAFWGDTEATMAHPFGD